jgi:hypothetical protein
MMTDSQLKQDLRAVRAFLSWPEKWTKEAFARDSSGELTCMMGRDATQWCLDGAVNRVCRIRVCRSSFARATTLRHALRHYVEGRGLTNWNDAPERTFEDVIALLDKAIEGAA